MPKGCHYSEAKSYPAQKRRRRKKHPSTKLKSELGRYRWGKEEDGLIPFELWQKKYGLESQEYRTSDREVVNESVNNSLES